MHEIVTQRFSALHGMAAQTSDEKGVCPSASLSFCLTDKRVHFDKTKERSIQIFIPHERSFSLVFWEKEWLVGATPSTRNFGLTGSRWSEIADFESIVACSASAVTLSEKNQLTLKKVHYVLSNEPKMNTVLCP